MPKVQRMTTDFGIDVHESEGRVVLTVRMPDIVQPCALDPADAQHLARELDQAAWRIARDKAAG